MTNLGSNDFYVKICLNFRWVRLFIMSDANSSNSVASSNRVEVTISDPKLKARYDSLWRKATLEIHPFQKGDSHQGTEHCIHILENLNKLTSSKNLSDIEAFLISCAALLHDIDKAISDYKTRVDSEKLHGVKGAEFILSHFDLFNINQEEARAIAFIVRKHGSEGFGNTDQIYSNFSISSRQGLINLLPLAAVFKLADMLDFSHKRLSHTITMLNYPEGLNNPKLVARNRMAGYQIVGQEILVSTLEINNCFEYQSVLTAIDMINEELLSTGTSELLKHSGYPYIFKLDSLILPSGDVRAFKSKRDSISRFNSEGRLTLDQADENKLMKLFQEYPQSLNFSKGELEQLKPIAPTLYSEISKKSINYIAKKLRGHFAYSIDELTIKRVYNRDCGIKCSLEYRKIEKPKGLNVSLPYSLTELSKKAKFVTDACANTCGASCRYVEEIKSKEDGLNGSFEWGYTNGLSYIGKLDCSFEILNAYAYDRSKIVEFYPDDLEFYEDFNYDIIYPICRLNICLDFPVGYKIEESSIKCRRYVNGQEPEDVVYNYDKAKNRYLIQILNQNISDIEQSPRYNFQWIVPENI